MSSLRTFSPRDLLLSVQKIKVCLYDTSDGKTSIPEGDDFYINQASRILDRILSDLGVQHVQKEGVSKLDDIFSKLNKADQGLFGISGEAVDNPSLQDVILKTDSIYERLYKREGSYCVIS